MSVFTQAVPDRLLSVCPAASVSADSKRYFVIVGQNLSCDWFLHALVTITDLTILIIEIKTDYIVCLMFHIGSPVLLIG